jgi:hypothetical protein
MFAEYCDFILEQQNVSDLQGGLHACPCESTHPSQLCILILGLEIQWS